MKKIDTDTYNTHNTICVGAAVWKTCVRLALKNTKGMTANIPLVFPLEIEVLSDLFEIFDTASMAGFKGKPCRFMEKSWGDSNIGVAHFMKDECIVYEDYWIQADPDNGPLDKVVEFDRGSMFTMATIEPPPGSPWRLRNNGTNGDEKPTFGLINSDGNPIAESIDWDLAMWLSRKARIATMDDDIPF